MHQEGHVGLNLVLFSPIAYWLATQDELLLMGFMLIGVAGMAPIPDIDMRLPIPHRGPTHSVWFAILVGVIYAAVLVLAGTGELELAALAGVGLISGFIGVIGHMLGDMITPMGVAPFEPMTSNWIGLGWVKSGDKRINRYFMQAGAYSMTAALLVGTVGVSSFIEPFSSLL